MSAGSAPNCRSTCSSARNSPKPTSSKYEPAAAQIAGGFDGFAGTGAGLSRSRRVAGPPSNRGDAVQGRWRRRNNGASGDAAGVSDHKAIVHHRKSTRRRRHHRRQLLSPKNGPMATPCSRSAWGRPWLRRCLLSDFRLDKDFTHIALFGGPPPAFAVTASFPAQTLQQYIDISRSRPLGITFASSGYGTHVHLMAELLKSLTGANMLHVPYNGGGPAMSRSHRWTRVFRSRLAGHGFAVRAKRQCASTGGGLTKAGARFSRRSDLCGIGLPTNDQRHMVRLVELRPICPVILRSNSTPRCAPRWPSPRLSTNSRPKRSNRAI